MEKISDLTKLVLHRGLCDNAVENSYKAFKEACLQRDVWGIETDIQFTKDGKCVCFHDKNGKRLMGVKKLIHDFGFEELNRLTLVNSDNTITADICPFKKYVKLCKKYNKVCVIEFKYDFSDKQIMRVIKTLKWHRYLKKCLLISFSTSVLSRLRKLLPKQDLQLLVTNPMKRYYNFCIANRVGVSLHWRLARRDTFKKFHDAGLQVSVWGVKGYSTALKLASYGVYSITSDKVM